MAGTKVDRLVVVLDYVLHQPAQTATLSEIAAAVGNPLSSTHDLLRAMVVAGLLEVDAGKRYRAGSVLLRLAATVVDEVDLVSTSRRCLDRLVDDVAHDAYLAIRSGDTVSYVVRVVGRYRAGLDIKLGEPVPLHASAVGKLYAASAPDLERLVMGRKLRALTPHTITDHRELAEEFVRVREDDFALSREETISGIVGFAAPVRDAEHRMIAAVHLSAFKDNLADGDIPRVARATQRCAADIQQALGTIPIRRAMA